MTSQWTLPVDIALFTQDPFISFWNASAGLLVLDDELARGFFGAGFSAGFLAAFRFFGNGAGMVEFWRQSSMCMFSSALFAPGRSFFRQIGH